MRITAFANGSSKNGKVVSVPSMWHTFLCAIGTKLNLNVKYLFNRHGGQIDDLSLIRDDDVLYASEGDNFIDPITTQCLPRKNLQTGDNCCQESAIPIVDTEWISLNIGGTLFTTTRTTLTRNDPNSMLARMFNSETGREWNSSKDNHNAFLIDRSPRYFEPILNYLRHGKLVLDKNINPEGVLEEAKFFGVSSLIDILEEVIENDQVPEDNTPVTRRELIMRLLSSHTNKELRCQGINFSGANLSKLDLRHINFKYAVLKNANLTGANLSYCNFERADLAKAVIDSANLLGVKMLCANLEGTSMKGCYFEDPAGCRANMEGALMKNVDLEGSHMAGVNLRVATLKNANLRNCDLRGAVLAGADLENCDLTGCDLQEANLRGANLKGATFELMLHPLHMAQTVR